MFKINKKLFILVLFLLLFVVIPTALAVDVGTDAVDAQIELGAGDPRTMGARIINIAVLFLGLIAVGIILLGGFRMMTAGGSEDKIDQAKKTIVSGVIGLVIVLSSWGIASFVLNKLVDATGGGSGGSGCTSGQTQICGCDGVRTCIDGSWGSCVGSNCGGPGSGSSACDANTIESGCQADQSICADGYFCDDSCVCQPAGGLGDPCDGDGLDDAVCSDPQDSLCGAYLQCSPDSCTCIGAPVITALSPIGGFCDDNPNRACASDSDCVSTCNIANGNGAYGNIISIHGYNFANSDSNKAWYDDLEGYSPGLVSGYLSAWSGDSASARIVYDSDASFSGNKGLLISQVAAKTDQSMWVQTVYDFSGVDFNLDSNYALRFKYKGSANNPLSVFTAVDMNTELAEFRSSGDVEGLTSFSPISSGSYDSWNTYELGFVADQDFIDNGPKELAFVYVYGNTGAGTEMYIDDFEIIEENTNRKVVFLGDPNNSADDVEAGFPFDVNPLCDSSWHDNEIIVLVPAGAKAGPIQVINDMNESDVTNNDNGPVLPDFVSNTIIRPGLCLLDSDHGMTNDPVNYYGVNLANSQSYFGNYTDSAKALSSDFSDPSSLRGVAYVPNVQSGKMSSFVKNTFNGLEQPSNYLSFVKDSDPKLGPSIISFYPEIGAPGQYVTIRGSGFGSDRYNSQVFFGDVEADYEFPDVCLHSVWTDKEVVVKVPENIENGNYSISMIVGDWEIDTVKIDPSVFEVNGSKSLSPSLCKITPIRGPNNSPVSLWGEYFGNEGQNIIARFYSDREINGVVQNDGDAQYIDTVVPNGAISGPVSLVKAGLVGNSLNFNVNVCSQDDDCGLQVCCPAGTTESGRCLDNLNDCYSSVVSSVYEWDFSTIYSTIDGPDEYDSCYGQAQRNGYCSTGQFCPNSPGQCSPYDGGGQKVVGSCDYSCVGVVGCEDGSCSYNSGLNRCVQNVCSKNSSVEDSAGNVLEMYCALVEYNNNQYSVWQTETAASCPSGWISLGNEVCVNLNSTCTACEENLECLDYGSDGICATKTICPDDAYCNSQNECVTADAASCECCCEIGQDERDCCAGLVCGGTCGSDATDDGVGFGFCSGCADSDDPDAACNCEGTVGKFCDLSVPTGACVDCSALGTQDECNSHETCCFDAQSQSCRGGDGTQTVEGGYGYCAYYDCKLPPVENECNATELLQIGPYRNVGECNDECSKNEGDSQCRKLDNLEDCFAEEGCCYDFGLDACIGGDTTNEGYCDYYNCDINNPDQCSANPLQSGRYSNFLSCQDKCQDPDPGGLDTNCTSTSAASCNTYICSQPFSCLTDSGSTATTGDCGVCCCDPAASYDVCSELGPGISCTADRGNCSGGDRGLCCGCDGDDSCGSPENLGCGINTCCQARPGVDESSLSPNHGDFDVCRNAAVAVTFTKYMDSSSLNSNFFLMEERIYGNGTCPPGTFLASGISPQFERKSWWGRLAANIKLGWQRVFAPQNYRALADRPNPNSLYCAVYGNVVTENRGDGKTTAVFYPNRLLNPNTKYYVLIKGDKDLDSQSGALSLDGIGMNERGYLDVSSGSYIESALLPFNTIDYPNSYIWKFTTLDGDDPSSGVCDIDYLSMAPYSYLFNTAENDLNEDDNDLNDSSFDTARDKDKVFVATAYSYDGQILHSVPGYAWDWNWEIVNTDIVNFVAASPFGSSPSYQDRKLIEAKSGVTDGQTTISATIDMSNYNDNVVSNGHGMSQIVPVSVFLCENPWPAVGADGNWLPWSDEANNCVADVNGQNCGNYNYSFYYCRDAGASGTYDDLPAILSDQAVVRGSSLLCSDPDGSCSGLAANASCGDTGICIWNVLKESYFFREDTPSAGQITDISDTGESGTVSISWTSETYAVASYRVYYQLSSNDESRQYQEVDPNQSCSVMGANWSCNVKVSGLENNQEYIFFVTVVNSQGAESGLSSQVKIIPTDSTPPDSPGGLSIEAVRE